MMRCKNCVLPDKFPGIRFDAQGVCNFCSDFKGKKTLAQEKLRYRRRFEDLVVKYKGKQSYDAIMAYSGGKDSTYTLSLLKESYGLNILAFTFDNGFLPEQAFRNIRNITETLGFDHIFFKPCFNILRKIFVECSKKRIYSLKALTRASSICTSCMAIVKFSTLRLALEKNIPFIVFGWSPGQIPIKSSIVKTNPQIIELMQKSALKPLYDLVGNKIRPYFLEEEHFKGTYHFPHNISPLAFHDYDENNILKKVNQFSWKAPEDVDAHSTNCLLNSFSNIIHMEQCGFHPYVFELAKLVREGHLERSIALRKLNQPEIPETVELVKRKLGL